MTNVTTGPISAASFLNGIGVDTHLVYTDGGYANIQNVIADLATLGITNVRDGISDSRDYNGNYNGSAPLSSYIQVAKAGIKFTIVVDVSSTAQMTYELGLIKQLIAAVPGSVVAVEGPNEINNEPVTYNGISGINGALAMQAALYTAVHGDAAFAGVKVDYFTGYDAGGVPVGPDPSKTAGLADADTQHPYPNYGQAPATWVARSNTVPNLANVNSMPVVYTETGYTSNQVGTTVQAKYELDLLLDTATQNIAKTYLYELMDAYAPGSAQGDAGWGLFDYTKAAKPVATAIHNLTSILQDTGATASTFVPAALAYTITGLPATGNSQVITKSDGTTYIAVWAEPQLVDPTTYATIAAPAESVTIKLPQSYGAIQVIDPLLGTAAIATYSNSSTVTFTVTDHPILIQLSTPGAATPPPVTAAADKLVLNVSEIQANGKDAQFTVLVDGKQVGGVQTVSASQLTGASQTITLTGNFGSGSHAITFAFLNNQFAAGATSADAGRELFVNSATLDNNTTFLNDQQIFQNPFNAMTVQAPATAVAANAGTTDQLVLNMAETAGGGQNAQFMVSVDGQLVGGVYTVTASKTAGQSQNFTLTGNFATGPHQVAIDLLNGNSGARTLFINSITLNGTTTAINQSNTYNYAPVYTIPDNPAELATRGATATSQREALAASAPVGTATSATAENVPVIDFNDNEALVGTGLIPSGLHPNAPLFGDFASDYANLLRGAVAGTTVTGSQNNASIQNLVQAMAVFSAADPGFSPTNTTHTNLGDSFFGSTFATGFTSAWHK